MWLPRAAAIAVLSALALGSAVGRSDDASKAPPPPASGFLEFLGSVDGLAELNPNYLPPPVQARRARPVASPGARPPPPPPPPPPPGDKNNG
jgi:hypothetical protein